MAKRHRSNLITASFHYLVKTQRAENDPSKLLDAPFSSAEFQRIVDRISNTATLDENDPDVITRLKLGQELPFREFQDLGLDSYFGVFDGVYYGQEYRNNLKGVIPADSLNMRTFNYLISRLRDGKILVGVTYNGQFGDYEGLKNCLCHLVRGNYSVSSRTITSLSDEVGNGVPTEIRLTYRNSSDRPERKGLFGKTGVIAVKNADFGDGFDSEVAKVADRVRGDEKTKKRALANFVKQGNVIELDDEDIIGCSAIIRQDGRTTTVYFLGGNNIATKFRLNVTIGSGGLPNQEEVKKEMTRIMRDRIMSIIQ